MNSIRKNFIYNSLYQILIILIPLITTPYLSRVLGANGIGTYSYAYSVANYYVLFIMLGLNNYGNRTIAQIRDNKEELSRQFWSIYTLQFLLGIIVNTIYFLYCIFISENVSISISLCLYVISASFDINWFFFGLEQFKLTVIRNTIIKILTTVGIFYFVKDPGDVLIYCLITSIGLFASQIVLWPFVIKKVKFYRPKISEVFIHVKPNLFLFLTVIAVSLFKIMDKIMLGLMTTKAQVGLYESAEKIIAIPNALITSLGTVMLPRMSNLSKKDGEQSTKLIYFSLLFAMFLSSSLSFGIMSVSKEFIPLFYGEGYEPCVYLFLILLPTCLFMAFANVIRTQYLLPHKMDGAYVISAFLGAGINISINIILIPLYGAIGAAIGTFFAEVIVCIYQCYMVKNYLPIKLYVKRASPFILSGLMMFLILYNVNLSTLNSILNLGIKIIIGIILYFLFLMIQLFGFKMIKRRSFFHYDMNIEH